MIESIMLEKMPNNHPHSIVKFTSEKTMKNYYWRGWFWKMLNGDKGHFAIATADPCCEIIDCKEFNAPQWKNQVITNFEIIKDKNLAKKIFGWKSIYNIDRCGKLITCNFLLAKLNILDWDDPCYLYIGAVNNYPHFIELKTATSHYYTFI